MQSHAMVHNRYASGILQVQFFISPHFAYGNKIVCNKNPMGVIIETEIV